jgi:hypothetical protein
MTPADRRISELIDKWLASIDLHLQYTELSDAAYARIQPWPKHDRPTRWVLEVARQKTLQLKSHCEARQAMGDSKFADSLELMSFLSNLVGVQHIQRFIPLADPEHAEAAATSPTTATAAPAAAPRPQGMPEQPTQRVRTGHGEQARQMPKVKPPAPPRPAAPAQGATSSPAGRPNAAAPSRPVAQSAPTRPRGSDSAASSAAGRSPSEQAVAAPAIPPEELRRRIIADAVRLLKWGKSWHELADFIARIAERPPAGEIRKMLRVHKEEIEAKAAAESG